MHSVVSARPVKPVVVGLDGSRLHLATVDLAVAEAVRRRAPLKIVHVGPGRYAGPWRPLTAPGRSDGRRLLDVAARRAAHHAPDLDVLVELLDGSAPAALARQSATAQLLVIGHRDELPIRPSWGSTAAYLAQHSVCPLLVHRGSAPDRGPVVLAASARPATTATAACAFEEAALLGTALLAVHVWRGERPDPAAVGQAPSRLRAAARREAEHDITQALAPWRASFPQVRLDTLVPHDLDIAYTVERASRRGRLLVVGMGRDGRSAELLYSSLGVTLLRQAACPVLLVPHAWSQPPGRRSTGLSRRDQGPARPGRSALPGEPRRI